jgi:hypothetical protein
MQTCDRLADGSDERRWIIGRDPIDRDVEWFDPLAAEVYVQPIDERRAEWRDRARRSE